MIRATWAGVVLAETDRTVVVEGTHYFPPDSIRWDRLMPSPSTSRCWWKGKAEYFSIVLDDEVNVDAAWCYPEPWPLARRIAGHVGFWRGVAIGRT